MTALKPLHLKAHASIRTDHPGGWSQSTPYAYGTYQMDGRSVTIPRPHVDAGDDLAWVVELVVSEDGKTLSFDFGRWSLNDFRLGRNVGLVVSDSDPTSDYCRGWQRRYLAEGRRLPDAAITEWVTYVVNEERAEREAARQAESERRARDANTVDGDVVDVSYEDVPELPAGR